MKSESGQLTIERGVVWEIGLNRPEKRNALSIALRNELVAALQEADEDPECRVIILFGHGPVFSAGADLYEAADMFVGEGKGSVIQNYGRSEAREHELVWQIRTPIISAIHGYVGPLSMWNVMSTDLVIAAEGTRLSFEQGRIGGAGADPRITFTIGARRYKEWRMMGRALDARRAMEWGLVNEVVPAEELMPTARKWAEELAEIPPRNVTANKLAINGQIESLGLWFLDRQLSFYAALGHGSDEDVTYFETIRDKGLRAALALRSGNGGATPGGGATPA